VPRIATKKAEINGWTWRHCGGRKAEAKERKSAPGKSRGEGRNKCKGPSITQVKGLVNIKKDKVLCKTNTWRIRSLLEGTRNTKREEIPDAEDAGYERTSQEEKRPWGKKESR